MNLASVLARRDRDDGQFALAHRAVPSKAGFLGASNDKSARVLLSISLYVAEFTVLEGRPLGGAREERNPQIGLVDLGDGAGLENAHQRNFGRRQAQGLCIDVETEGNHR